MTSYGELPAIIGKFEIECKEMMFYQYLPIKLAGTSLASVEKRLDCFSKILSTSMCDFIGVYGLDRFINSYVYVTAKNMFQPKGCSYNRCGYHSDGFLTDDINYIWSDNTPTVFNKAEFNLPMDDKTSLDAMEYQAKDYNEITYPNNTILRLDQYCIHKVGDKKEDGMRAFVKVSISKDKYDLIGNSHNYLLDYDWKMKQRSIERNIPQSILK